MSVATQTPRGGVAERALDALVKALTIAGVVFAAWQYLEARQEARIARTLAYVERFEQGDVGAARQRINGVIREYLPQFANIEGITQEDRDSMVLSIVEVGGASFERDIDLIVDFFHGLSICVQEVLCERGVAERYFASSDATNIWANFEPYVRTRRENNPAFARALEAFVGG